MLAASGTAQPLCDTKHIGRVLGWALWHPKGREPPNCCCAPAKHAVGVKRGFSEHEACPQLPMSPCSWGINELEAAPTPLALGAFPLGSALWGLDSWEGLVVSFLHAKRIFLLDRYTRFLTRSLFSKYHTFPEKQTWFDQPATQLQRILFVQCFSEINGYSCLTALNIKMPLMQQQTENYLVLLHCSETVKFISKMPFQMGKDTGTLDTECNAGQKVYYTQTCIYILVKGKKMIFRRGQALSLVCSS